MKKIILIRHGRVAVDWKKKLTSKEYDQAWEDYNLQPIHPIEESYEIPEDAKVFTTTFLRTQETARQYLHRDDFTIIEGLADEVPLRSYKDTAKPKNVNLMNVRGRLQWYTHGKRQEEWRNQSRERANKLIDFLEADPAETCVVVFHGFFLRTVRGILKKRGYKVDNRVTFRVPNLCVITGVNDDWTEPVPMKEAPPVTIENRERS